MVSQYYYKMIGTYHQEYFSQQQTYASLLGMCLLLDHYVIIYYKFNFLLSAVWMYHCIKIILNTGIHIAEDNSLKELELFWLFWNVIACIYRDANLRAGKGTWELLVGVIEHALRVYSAK